VGCWLPERHEGAAPPLDDGETPRERKCGKKLHMDKGRAGAGIDPHANGIETTHCTQVPATVI
jgi:hypothetical protein